MWLFCDRAFASITLAPNTKNRLQVRCRVRQDIDRLREVMPLGETIDTPHNDYPYRAIITPAQLARGVGQLVRQIDYPNFKSRVAEVDGAARVQIYHRVWADLLALQNGERPYGRESERKGR